MNLKRLDVNWLCDCLETPDVPHRPRIEQLRLKGFISNCNALVQTRGIFCKTPARRRRHFSLSKSVAENATFANSYSQKYLVGTVILCRSERKPLCRIYDSDQNTGGAYHIRTNDELKTAIRPNHHKANKKSASKWLDRLQKVAKQSQRTHRKRILTEEDLLEDQR